MGKSSRKRGAGAARRVKQQPEFNPRPFEGLADETEWVALRELVPSATARVSLAAPEHAERKLTIATVLPMAYPALVRRDGHILLGVQANGRSGDLSRDLGLVLEAALASEPGVYIDFSEVPREGSRLQDLLGDGGQLDMELHDTFEFWLEDDSPKSQEVTESLERANASILPTTRLTSAKSAYWCQASTKAHLRWVLPEEEPAALDALARLRAAGELTLGDQTRYAGAFRAHGLLVPVFDLPHDLPAESWEDQLSVLSKSYEQAAASSQPLDSAEKQARSVIAARQLTLR